MGLAGGRPVDKPLLLLIEDEALLAISLEAELSEEGFEVVAILDGINGMGELDRDVSRFAALVTDIRLPGTDGWAIGKRARELNPTLPVVYMSGDSGGDWHAYGVPGSIMLSKPFASAQLIAAVANLINEVPPSA